MFGGAAAVAYSGLWFAAGVLRLRLDAMAFVMPDWCAAEKAAQADC